MQDIQSDKENIAYGVQMALSYKKNIAYGVQVVLSYMENIAYGVQVVPDLKYSMWLQMIL